MITVEDLEKKALKRYPESKELRDAYIKGCQDIAKLVFDRETQKKEENRSKSEPFYEGFKNAVDGIRIYLNPIIRD